LEWFLEGLDCHLNSECYVALSEVVQTGHVLSLLGEGKGADWVGGSMLIAI
jgi:hypothetical protein